MIKSHNVTGLKYLCITKRADWEDYTGSGGFWKNHLKIHGTDISTHLLFESDDYDEFVTMCYFCSDFYNVVESDEFANLVPEHGYNDRLPSQSKSNVELWWDIATDEMKSSVYAKRRDSLLKCYSELANPEYGYQFKCDVDLDIDLDIVAIKKIIWKFGYKNFDALCELREGVPLIDIVNEASEILSELRRASALKFINENPEIVAEQRLIQKEGMENFHNDKDSDVYKGWYAAVVTAIKDRWENMTEEDMLKFSKTISNARKNLSPEKREERKRKIREVYKTGKHDELFKKMSEDRMGTNNPYAKKVMWMGELWTKLEFEKMCKEFNFSQDHLNLMFSTRDDCMIMYDTTPVVYEEVVCPHCGKTSGSKKPSSFKRWHFDNCKMKGTE